MHLTVSKKAAPQGMETFKIQLEQNEVKMSKRRHQRIEVPNLIANLSDGVDSFSGPISNISRLGMLLNKFPQSLTNQGKKMSITVSAKGKDFKMHVEPKWVFENETENKMGLAILGPPLGWTIFVMICEPTGEDIWAVTTHLPGERSR